MFPPVRLHIMRRDILPSKRFDRLEPEVSAYSFPHQGLWADVQQLTDNSSVIMILSGKRIRRYCLPAFLTICENLIYSGTWLGLTHQRNIWWPECDQSHQSAYGQDRLF